MDRKRIHFIAMGGAIMHQLTLALHRQGNIVSGSDDEINDPAKSNLQAAGLLPAEEGWHPERITKGLDAVVLGMHAKGDNPELLRAQELGIPIYSFPEYVYELSRNKQRVVVAGSHGKTTITSMIMHVLQAQGKSFDYLVGAKVAGFGSSVQLSDAPSIVLEGDEYPASVVEKKPKIFFYHPHISVLSGIAWDHVNVFPTFDFYLDQFRQYLRGMQPGTRLFYNDTDEEVRRLVAECAGHLEAHPYAMPQYRYEDGTAIVHTRDGEVKLSVFGSHNLLNMEGARAVCNALGVDDAAFWQSIASFTGAARRLEKLTERENVVVFRDFAHAPSKLKATLEAVREAYPKHRLIAVFELHTFSSLTESFQQEYAGSMNAADDALVFFSKHALELKGLPPLEKDRVAGFFKRDDLAVTDDAKALQEKVTTLSAQHKSQPVCLLLMSSGTFDGTDWNSVVSVSEP